MLEQDRPGDEEMRGVNPCYRNRYMERLDWDREAWLAFCVQRTRSRFVSQAWKNGLDSSGEKLEADAPARKLDEMEHWLRRIPGKYRIEGKYWNSGGSSPIGGTADCFAVGSGPGVSCLISTVWKAPKQAGDPDSGKMNDTALNQALYLAMRGVVLLFGTDPGASQVRVTLLDFRGVGMSGFLDDGVVMFDGRPGFEFPTLNPTITYTWHTSVVAAKPDGDMAMKFLVRASDIFSTPEPILFDLQLHRESADLSQVSQADFLDLGPESDESDYDSVSESFSLAPVDSESPDVDEPEGDEGEGVSPVAKPQLVNSSAIDALDEVSISGEQERQRQAQFRDALVRPDIVTVTRNGSTRMRLQPYSSQSSIRFRRQSSARLASRDVKRPMELRRDLLTSGDEPKIRDVTLDLGANIDEPDGVPALIPFGKRTSLVNIDHVRLNNVGRSTLTKVTNAINPQSRSCAATLGLADNGDEFRNRFVLLGDRLKDCESALRNRHGDLFFADELPRRLQQELTEIYEPVYNRFARLLGSEPGMVFVAWRDSPKRDLRFERNWSRSTLLLFSGSSWQEGIAPQVRKSLENRFAAEQIVRRLGWQDERNDFTQSAMNYLLMLNEWQGEHATARRLSAELPDWIGRCAGDQKNLPRVASSGGEVVSYYCGLVLHFVYDAVARAKTRGGDTIYATWRGLLTESFRRGKSGVEPGSFIASADSRQLAQGFLGGTMDWSRFFNELDKVGVRMNVRLELSTPVVEVESLVHFRD